MSELSQRPRRTIVVKIGSAILTNDGAGLDAQAVKTWVGQMVELLDADFDIVLVSSGSIVEGIRRLGWPAPTRGGPRTTSCRGCRANGSHPAL